MKVILPIRIKILIYNALIVSRLSYCCTIFGGAKRKHINKLSVVQRKALRLICLEKRSAHADPLYFKTGTLKMEHIIELNYIKIGYKLARNEEPPPIASIFNFKEINSTDIMTRSCEQKRMNIPKCNLKSANKFSSYIIPKIWNTAVDALKINIQRKIHTLINTYKFYSLQSYGLFICEKVNCYSCN